MKRAIGIVVVGVVLLAAGCAWYLRSPLAINSVTDVYIPKGSSVFKATQVVQQSHCIRHPLLFRLMLSAWCRLNSSTIYAGSYRFNVTNTHFQLLRALLSGKQVLKVRVTFPEGLPSWRFASILQKNVGIDSAAFMKEMMNDSLIKALGIQATSLEGYLKPDTYEYFWKQPTQEIIEGLVSQQNKLWNEKFQADALQQGKTRAEVMTMASIVEAETPQADERARVAGVYENRLAKGMRLEADPTVQYAIGPEARWLSLADLRFESPYNTYLHSGLPPGPINNPGELSIAAALHPEVNSYYFFCAKGDRSNSHYFSSTINEHHVNVMRYRHNLSLSHQD